MKITYQPVTPVTPQCPVVHYNVIPLQRNYHADTPCPVKSRYELALQFKRRYISTRVLISVLTTSSGIVD
jgi:hypothetical protein